MAAVPPSWFITGWSGLTTTRIVYDFKTGIPNVPTPLAKDGRLYILCDNGLLRCVRAATGEPIWQERLPARFYASPVWAENRLYLTIKADELFLITPRAISHSY